MARKKIKLPKVAKLSPLSGFGKDRIGNRLLINKNPKTASSFTNNFKSSATNYGSY